MTPVGSRIAGLLALTDVNGDGHLDAVVVDGTLVVRLGDGAGHLGTRRQCRPPSPGTRTWRRPTSTVIETPISS